MRERLLVLALIAFPALGGYASKATVTFPGATGSTQTNFTVAFTFSDTKLKTVANGGQVQSTSTRVGVTVPNDLVFTDDATCGSLTGSYTWGYESYSATTGAGVGWLMIPSHTTSAHVPNVCVGNAAVVTYQGGAAGAEFDANVLGAWHFPDGNTLSPKDFSANAKDGTNVAALPTSGQIGGAIATAGSQYLTIPQSAISGFNSVTFRLWIKTTATNNMYILGDGFGVCANNGFATLQFNSSAGFHLNFFSDASVVSTPLVGQNPNDGAWHYVVGIYAPTSLSIQMDGNAPVVTTGLTNANIGAADALNVGGLCSNFGGGTVSFVGSIDDLVISKTIRPANWISTEFANQSSPPVIGAFTGLAGGPPNPSISVIAMGP